MVHPVHPGTITMKKSRLTTKKSRFPTKKSRFNTAPVQALTSATGGRNGGGVDQGMIGGHASPAVKRPGPKIDSGMIDGGGKSYHSNPDDYAMFGMKLRPR